MFKTSHIIHWISGQCINTKSQTPRKKKNQNERVREKEGWRERERAKVTKNTIGWHETKLETCCIKQNKIDVIP